MNNKSRGPLLRGGPHLPCIPGRTSQRTQLLTLCPCLFIRCRSAPAGKLWFPLSNTRLRPALSNQNCTVWIPHLKKKGLIGTLDRNLQYKKEGPLCLGGTQFKFLLQSVSLGLLLFVFKEMLFILYYCLTLSLVYTAINLKGCNRIH